ncbi:MAG: KH domain-containing protein [Chloroflexota bacterium]|nr:KH domain-containing protein [Dehalococcoidia bacterium]MDW8253090.1 KH domain-containing protein [Chloroflexota bacterium]
MKALIEYIASSIVDHPEQVQVREVRGRNSTILELRVAPDDMGRVIGKQGRIASAMRTLLKAAATRSGGRYVLEIE